MRSLKKQLKKFDPTKMHKEIALQKLNQTVSFYLNWSFYVAWAKLFNLSYDIQE